MLTDWILEFGKAKLHLEDFRLEGFAKSIRLGAPRVATGPA
jgi:hypothetical protein